MRLELTSIRTEVKSFESDWYPRRDRRMHYIVRPRRRIRGDGTIYMIAAVIKYFFFIFFFFLRVSISPPAIIQQNIIYCIFFFKLL